MNFDEALVIVQSLLKKEGKALNSQMTDALGRDRELFERVREYLIFNDLAEDKKGVGLIYTGPKDEKAPGPAVGSEEAVGERTGEEAEKSRQTGLNVMIEKAHEEKKREESPGNAAGGRAKEEAGPANSRKIFISYGHKDATELAFKLDKDLRDLGHKVWLDKRDIESGKSWEETIEKGILGCEIFISLLSPYAVRRSEGVCLDEISMARFNQKRIIPTMVIQCMAPLCIYRLDWVDFQDWEQPARYEKAFNRLLSAIESKEECVEGMYARLFSNLRPLDFSLDLSRLTRDFTGRKWLEDEIEHWLLEEESRVFFITGDPGTGKSAMMAHLVNRHPQVAAYHFCTFNLKDSLDPLIFVRSIAAQLATQLDGYRSAIETIELEKIAEEDPGTLLRRLIADPLKGENPEKPVLLLVDALDEAFQAGGRNIVKVLHERLADLPPWIRLVLTSRKELPILDLFRRYHPHEIEADREENREDILDYLRKKFSKPALSTLLSLKGVECTKLAELLSEKGKGNFLYVVQALDAIESGQIDPHDPDSFPDGLVGMYHMFFERKFPDGKGFESIRPILDVILAAREPLTAKQIGAFLGRDEFEVRKELEDVAPYFPKRDEKYSVYHKSVSDWLIGEAGSSMMFQVNINGGHSRIAEYLIEDWRAARSSYRSKDRSLFTLSHLPHHLTHSERWDDLESVLCDLFFIDAKCTKGMTYELVSDYKMALDVLPEAQEERRKEEERKGRMKRWTREIIEYSRKWSEAREKHAEDPVKYPMPKDEKIPLPELPQSMGPSKSEEPDEERDEADEAVEDRLNRIRAFSRFMDSNIHLIPRYASLYPGFCLQQAYNYAKSGPVEKASKDIPGEIKNSVLLLQINRPSYNPNPTLLKTFSGHEDRVTGVSITPDGRYALSGSYDKTLRLWDIEKGECVKIFSGHEDKVTSVSITPDGKYALSGSNDKTLRLWDMEKGECVKTFSGHEYKVTSVSITSDGRYALSGSLDKTLRLWDMEKGECVKTFSGHEYYVTSVSITPDGKYALSGSSDINPDGWSWPSGRDNTLRIWDIEKGECVNTFSGHEDRVTGVCITPDGKYALSGSDDNTIRLWDIEKDECVKIFSGHEGGVKCVNITPDGRYALSGSDDSTLRLWDIEKGECVITFSGHESGVTSVSITPDGRYALSGSIDNTIRLWDIEKGGVKTFSGHEDRVTGVSITPDGRYALSGSIDNTLRLWDINKWECVRIFSGHTWSVYGVSITPDGRHALSGSSDNTLRLWDINTCECVKTFSGHTGWVYGISITPDGRHALSGSNDRTLRLWDIEKGECVKTFSGHRGGVTSVSVTPDGKYALSGSDDNTLCLWDMEKGECTAIYHAGSSVLSISDTGGAFAIGTSKGEVIILNLQNLPVEPPPIITLLQSPGGSPAFGCPHCRTWSEIPEPAPGREIPCPKCNRKVRLNPFAIKADWRPSAKAWRGDIYPDMEHQKIEVVREHIIDTSKERLSGNPVLIGMNDHGFEEYWIEKDGSILILIPEGKFIMGSNKYGSEKPQRNVYIDAYYISKYPITAAQYRKFCRENGRSMPSAPSWGWRDDHPIVSVTWHDAKEYSDWAGLRLLTEAEWEKAARGTDGREYPWGAEWDENKCCNRNNSKGKGTAPVGSYGSGISPYGCLDMAGNVWEWCNDWYDSHYYKNGPSENPEGPSSGVSRVVRGGSWRLDFSSVYRCARRRRDGWPDFRRNFGYGFRFARTPR